MRARDEPLLEGEASVRRLEPRPQLVVGRRDDRGVDAESRCEPGRDGGEGFPCTKALRAQDMQAEVAVAEPEPRVAAELLDARECIPRLVRATPAALLVRDSCERVEHAVEIR